MARRYTVQDRRTGKNITFEWNSEGVPTEVDLEQVFSEAQGQQPQERTWGQAIKEGVENIPASAEQNIMSMAQAIANPVETAKAVAKPVIGALQMAGPSRAEYPYQEDVNRVTELAKQRYGSGEAIKGTLATDPVGMLSDVSTVLTGAGGVLSGAGAVSKVGTLSKIGKTVSKAGAASEPIGLMTRTVTEPVTWAIPKALPSKMYQSASKFSTTLSPKERAKLVNTAFENQILPSVKGVEKANEMLTDLGNKIGTKIDEATATGKFGNVGDLFKGFDDLIEKESVIGETSRKAIENLRDDILKENQAWGRILLTPDQVQKIKHDFQQRLSSLYGQMMDAPAAKKAQNLVAVNAREMLENMIPDIKGLNAEYGPLKELKDALERSAGRITNRDMLGIGVPLKGIVGSSVGGLPGAATGISVALLDTPAIKGKLSFLLERMRTDGFKVRPTPAAIRLGLFQSGRNYPSSEKGVLIP